ncbi:carbohydrate ABC transporter membrane protein 1, CUT1 family [Deinococcus geothermalis DSM 11300]|uniref:Maltose/maltodextrin transport system permease protein n=1 Tax=Deinococcus geothermalis (strain DSM 11300 / CIP 105573 / AG-3a) TaxID=319795 RepID=Q1IY88_DEIGD|nr:ABC transporter permease subunit [Deinococcus geothermalis]ABF45796.1 carbohydrate ABC transporter membrane protein 1, CUT1 family [Deinococcus geothermalis DSM 11300]
MTAILPSKPPRRTAPPDGASGVLLAVLVLLLLLGGAALIGWLLSGLTASVLPKAPPYLILIYALAALLLAMPLTARLVPWITNWYYLFPALVFLAAFTVLPIIMTVNYAFTNYSGQNSGNPDSAVRADARLSPDRRTVTLAEIPEGGTLQTYLKCTSPTCAGDTLVLLEEDAATPLKIRIASVQGRTVTLAAPVPQGFALSSVTRLNRYDYVGLANFREIFAKASSALWPVFVWTVVFAFSTVVLNALAGLILGILLYNKRLKGRNIYRTLLFLPWAIPAVISVQMWAALLNQQFGIVNKTLGLLGFAAVPWLIDPLWAKISVLLVNLWLGFPYMMTATISALGTINDDLYEAASIDGASRWQQTTNITLPLLRQSFTPILLSSFAFNFNNFTVIYLLTAGGPGGPGGPPVQGHDSTAGATDLLINWGYNNAFGAAGGQNYALASAVALIIFFLTLGISLVNFRAAGIFEEARR